MFSEDGAREKLQNQFQVSSLKGYGIDTLPGAVVAAGAVLYYLEFTEHRQTKHIASISRIDPQPRIVRFEQRTGRLFALRGA